MNAACDKLCVRFLKPFYGVPPSPDGVFSALGVLTFGEFFSSGTLTITEFDEYGAIGSPGKF